MKKNILFYLFAVVCSMSLFTACSDDDDDTTWKEIPEIAKENVSVKFNNKDVTNATASFEALSAEQGKVTLNNLIYGHEKVEVDVTLTKKDDTSYNFTGTANLQAPARANLVSTPLQMKVSGTVTTDGKLTVDVETSGWASSTGTYEKENLAITVNGEAQANTYPVTLVVTSAEGAATLTFNKIVNVANDFTMDVKVKDGKIEGSKEKESGYTINVKGELSNGKLTVAVTTTGYATVSGSYYATGNKITYHTDKDQELPAGAYVSVIMLSESKANLEFGNLLSGSRSGTVQGVAVTSKDGVYTFNGKSNGFGYTLAFEGTIDANRMMTAKVTYATEDCGLVGKWKPLMEGSLAKTLVQLETKSGTVKFSKEILAMLPEELKPIFSETMTDDQVSTILNNLLGTYCVYLQNLEFTKGGRMVATYIDMPKDINGDGKIDASDLVGQTPKSFGLLQYYRGVYPDHFYLTASLSDLMGMLPMSNGRAWDPGTMLTEGIPFTYFMGDNSALITITDEVINTQTLNTINGLLSAFGPMIPGFAENKPMIDAVMTTVASVLGETVRLRVGLNLQKM